jgi:hypothetical protein
MGRGFTISTLRQVESTRRGGIRLTRDTLVSVMYSEKLHSSKSSVALQRTERHGLWDDSMRIFKCLCDNAQQSICRLARQIGLSKSSVKGYALAIGRRLKQAQK